MTRIIEFLGNTVLFLWNLIWLAAGVGVVLFGLNMLTTTVPVTYLSIGLSLFLVLVGGLIAFVSFGRIILKGKLSEVDDGFQDSRRIKNHHVSATDVFDTERLDPLQRDFIYGDKA